MDFFNRAAATANRLVRTQQVEAAISNLRGQQRKVENEIGVKVLEKYRAGQFTDPDLVPSFQSWDNLAQQIAQKENEKKAIEAEANQPPAPARQQPAPAAPPAQAYGHLCSKERIPIPAGASFCPNCGSPAIDVPPPAPAAA